MKRQIAAVCFFSLVWCACAFADFGGGSGTADDPYLIYTKEHLCDPLMVNGAIELHVKLMDDIDLEGEPIPTLRFYGVFDGNHKSIKNLYMENQHGFISLATNRSNILKDLTLENPILVITQDGLSTGIMSETFGSTTTVENCHIVNGVIKAPLTLRDKDSGIEGVTVGGFAEGNMGHILNSSFSGSAEGYWVGGLVVYNARGASIENSDACIDILAPEYAGGLVARNFGFLKNCSTSGIVRTTGTDWTNVGGLVGYNIGNHSGYYDGNGIGDGGGQILDCHSSCDVFTNGKGAGGLVGNCWSGSMCNCYATGLVSGDSYLGGLVGTIQTYTYFGYMGVIEKCYSTGAVSGHDRIGGLAGENGSAIIRNCYSFGSATGVDIVGGLVGCVYFYPTNGSGTAIVDRCYSVGKVTGSQRTGGMIGREWNGTQVVTNSFWDRQTSGWTTSVKGTGKTTSQMKTLSTFTNAGWDFVGETANGEEDIWLMVDANYPILSWQFVNTAPVAEAGAGQTVGAWIDGWAQVQLDGGASYDADGDALSYLWSWQIDGNSCDANGVDPVIELPVGEHLITLIVNDGAADSEPNTCMIIVTEPVNACLMMFPRTIVRHAKGPKNLLAVMRLPDDVTGEQVDPNEGLVLYPGDIECKRLYVVDCPEGEYEGVTIFAFFDRAELLDAIGENGTLELQVAGQLRTGEYFCAADSIRIKENIRTPKAAKRPKPEKGGRSGELSGRKS